MAVGVPQIQTDFVAVSPQGGPDIAVGVAQRQGFNCQAGRFWSQEQVGLGGQDHSQPNQDKCPIKFLTLMLTA